MFRTVITPKETDIHLTIPIDYIGKEIEVLLYSTDEFNEEKAAKTSNAALFKGLLTEEESEKYHAYLKQARTEWERDI